MSLFFLFATGCAGPAGHFSKAERVAGQIITDKQQQALGRIEPFSVVPAEQTLRYRLLGEQGLATSHPASGGSHKLDSISHWPRTGYSELLEKDQGDAHIVIDAQEPLSLSLFDALQVAAANSREYQDAKERVFRAALALDLERNTFRNILFARGESQISTDRSGEKTRSGVENSASGGVSRALQSGTQLTTQIAFDLVRMLNAGGSSSMGLQADASIAIPLWRGSGRHIVGEPLLQAERDVVYAIWEFERFKHTFVVGVASGYLGVLSQLDQVENAEDNYRRLVSSTRRARRLADAGRLPEIQVDQAVQDELRARDRWISARQAYARTLDNFRISLGLPPDARVTPDRDELQRLADLARARLDAEGPAASASAGKVPPADAPIILNEPSMDDAGPYELPEQLALRLAFDYRLDLRIAQERTFDAQRGVVVAADALKGELTLLGRGFTGERRSLGSAALPDARLRPESGFYSALLSLDLPIERIAERNAFRNSYLNLEQRVRALQEQEDRVKGDVRNRLRDLVEFREGLHIQAQAVRVAQRRVESTSLFLQAGRAEIRDLLEAQEALVGAQNALTSALVNYRVAELELQRDMGVLKVDEKGLWTEFDTMEIRHEGS
ncbi:TolC family protein [Geoalkalibacter ferrihydriticus]|uniref:TolC family protein n=1 Tax=Geoalkalibacter ferrihydriticus TaxID=392333 RepID=UPI000693CBED|nr:TolC family protein [Geoalkalibacter ferrihydriticus]